MLKTKQEKLQGFTNETLNLIKEIEEVNLRQEYIFDIHKITKKLKEIYKVCDLEMPKIKVCIDITDKNFLGAAGAAVEALTARAARAAGAAVESWTAGEAVEALTARTALTARMACDASAGAARMACDASAGAAGIDYDFDYLVQEFEYLQHKKGNNNDKKALKLYQLFFEAKKLGLGYFAEKNKVLYICPNPIVKINQQNQFHSLTEPAIYWKNGLKCYFINGVYFGEELFKKLPTMSAKEILAIKNMEQRRVAYQEMDKSKMKEFDFKVLDEVKDDGYGYSMKVIEFNVNDIDFRYLNCFCPKTGREYYLETRETKCWLAKNKSFGLNENTKFDKEF